MNSTHTHLKNIYHSTLVRRVLAVLLIVIAGLLILRLGISIGYHKARFAEGVGNNFERNFGPMRQEQFGKHSKDLPGGHGAVGKIVSINAPLIVVADRDTVEKTIVVKDDTLIRKLREEIKVSDLKVGDMVMVLGTPNTLGQVEAKLIRTLPTPTSTSTNSTQR